MVGLVEIAHRDHRAAGTVDAVADPVVDHVRLPVGVSLDLVERPHLVAFRQTRGVAVFQRGVDAQGQVVAGEHAQHVKQPHVAEVDAVGVHGEVGFPRRTVHVGVVVQLDHRFRVGIAGAHREEGGRLEVGRRKRHRPVLRRQIDPVPILVGVVLSELPQRPRRVPALAVQQAELAGGHVAVGGAAVLDHELGIEQPVGEHLAQLAERGAHLRLHAGELQPAVALKPHVGDEVGRIGAVAGEEPFAQELEVLVDRQAEGVVLAVAVGVLRRERARQLDHVVHRLRIGQSDRVLPVVADPQVLGERLPVVVRERVELAVHGARLQGDGAPVEILTHLRQDVLLVERAERRQLAGPRQRHQLVLLQQHDVGQVRRGDGHGDLLVVLIVGAGDPDRRHVDAELVHPAPGPRVVLEAVAVGELLVDQDLGDDAGLDRRVVLAERPRRRGDRRRFACRRGKRDPAHHARRQQRDDDPNVHSHQLLLVGRRRTRRGHADRTRSGPFKASVSSCWWMPAPERQRRWQRGQWKLERPPWRSARIAAPQRGHGRPARP